MITLFDVRLTPDLQRLKEVEILNQVQDDANVYAQGRREMPGLHRSFTDFSHNITKMLKI